MNMRERALVRVAAGVVSEIGGGSRRLKSPQARQDAAIMLERGEKPRAFEGVHARAR